MFNEEKKASHEVMENLKIKCLLKRLRLAQSLEEIERFFK